jgi:hypothetical protein
MKLIIDVIVVNPFLGEFKKSERAYVMTEAIVKMFKKTFTVAMRK